MKQKAPKKLTNFDRLTYICGILLPIMTLPQVYEIWVNRQTAGVSLATWLMYTFIAMIFAIYGIIHKQKLLMITYIPFAIVEAAVVIGLLIY